MNLLLRVNKLETSNNCGIFIDGIDINSIELDVYRTKLTVIPQAPAIFSQSLRDNLSSDDKIQDEVIINLLKSFNFKCTTLST